MVKKEEVKFTWLDIACKKEAYLGLPPELRKFKHNFLGRGKPHWGEGYKP